MVDKLTPRLGLPEPFLTNPLKVDVGRITQALEMIDSNAVMLKDWDIAADGWQKMATIKGMAQGKIAASLMVVTGTGFANILFQTGDGSVTTVGDPARMTVSTQTNLGANTATLLDGRVVETTADEYEIWFEIAAGTSPRKWSALLIAGNGATIDWTHAVGAQPAGGVDLQIARALTSFDIASETKTAIGTLLTTGHIGAGAVAIDYLTTVDLKGRMWKTGELVRIKKADATEAKGFPPLLVTADPSATGWFIRCLSINETHLVRDFEFTSESAGAIRTFKARLTGVVWSSAKVYTSLDKPSALDLKVLGMRDPVTGSDVLDLNDMYGPTYYGVSSIMSVASATAANNYPFDEIGTVLVLPFGDAFSATQLYVTKSGRVAARTYDGSAFTGWRKQANSGVNDDINSMTGLTGAFKLGGDGVGDYDAVTMRQLRASSGGGGATMNGVVNNFLGAVEWWNGSRAKTPAGYVPADGQLLKRVDYPEIWAAIKAGILNSVSDTIWRGSKFSNPDGFGYHRAKYSLGYKADGTTDGTLTDGDTFRMPDLNGVKVDGIGGWTYGTSSPALHLRGDTFGVVGTLEAGTVSRNAAPNITGFFPGLITSGFELGSAGATIGTGPSPTVFKGKSARLDSYSASDYGYELDASRSAGSYGRDGTTEVRPNSAIGIWLIRVAGSFVAASTNFSVLTGDTTLPGNNTALKGGDLRSVYQINGVDHMAVTLRAAGVVGGNYTPVIEQIAPVSGSATTKTWTFPQAAGELLGRDSIGISGAKIPLLNTANTWGAAQTVNSGIVLVSDSTSTNLNDRSGPVLYSKVSTSGTSRLEARFFANFNGTSLRRAIIQVTSDATAAQTFAFSEAGDISASKGNVQWSGSDVRIKSEFQPPALGHQKRIAAIGVAEYLYKGNSYISRGFLAQQMATIDERYVYAGGEGMDDDGNAFDILNVDTRAVVADLVSTVQDLLNEISGLKTEISRLKS